MQQAANHTSKRAIAAFLVTTTLVIILGALWGIKFLVSSRAQAPTQTVSLAIGGFPMAGKLAPDFTLTDQFNQTVSLSSLHGHEVVLAFIDSRCQTLCPLTSNIMYKAKMQLSPDAASRVDLVAVNANPAATSVETVQAWSIAHGMLHQWSFLTGTAQQLEVVYHAYNVYVQTDSDGNATHDPIMFIIDAQGHERLYYETLSSNAQADLNAEESGLVAGMHQYLPGA